MIIDGKRYFKIAAVRAMSKDKKEELMFYLNKNMPCRYKGHLFIPADSYLIDTITLEGSK